MNTTSFNNAVIVDMLKSGNLYVGLSTSNPGGSGDKTGEPSGNNYSRQPLNLGNPISGNVKNSADITFNIASGSWGTITYYMICTKQSNTTSDDTVYIYGKLRDSDGNIIQRTIEKDMQLIIPANSINISVGGTIE